MNKISSNRSKACEIHPVVASLNHMYRSRIEKCTEVDSFIACAYLCTEVDLYRNRLPFVPNASCTELDLPSVPTNNSNPETCQNMCGVHHLSLLQISTGTESDITATKHDEHHQKANNTYFSISDIIYICTIYNSYVTGT